MFYLTILYNTFAREFKSFASEGKRKSIDNFFFILVALIYFQIYSFISIISVLVVVILVL